MKLKLMSLKINNFKAIKNIEIAPDGKNLAVTGKNGLGKTTIYDAFLWLLFGKNSLGEMKFTFKPTDEPPEVENSVEATFEVDGKPFELKKVYASKYVKNTGEFKGSELECYINGVPKKIREYEAAIADIISEERFELLTNPKHFTEIFDWKQRRQLLFSIINSKTDAEIAAESFPDISADLLKYGSSTEMLKAVNAQVKANSERINVLPKLINENLMKNCSPVDVSTLKNKIESQKALIMSLRNNRADLSAKPSDLENKLQTLNNQLSSLDYKNKVHLAEQQSKFVQEENDLKLSFAGVERNLSTWNLNKSNYAEKLKLLNTALVNAIDEYNSIKSSEFNSDGLKCPYCKQELPQDKLTELQSNFEVDKKNKLAKNVENGQQLRSQLNAVKSALATAQENIDKSEKDLEQLKSKQESFDIPFKPFDLPEYEQMKAEYEKSIEELMNEREKLPNVAAELADYDMKIGNAELEIERLNTLIAENNIAVENAKRVEELKAEQASLRQTQADLQKKSDMVNDFIRFKTDLITNGVNNLFEITKFKLFEPNKTNDGLTECCEPLAHSANRYNDINTAGKTKVGIDIIKTLCRVYDIYVPLFVDNIDNLDTDNYRKLITAMSDGMQLITLRVSDDTEIKTEVF